MFDKMDILRPFLDRPAATFGIRELAREVGISPMTARKHLLAAMQDGFLTARRERRLQLFRANDQSERYRDLKRHRNVQRLRDTGLLDFLRAELNEPLAIFLFGSFAKGENTPESDVDLFVLTNAKRRLDLDRFQKKLGAKVQLLVHTPADIDVLKKNNPHLVNNILNGVRLAGFWEVF